MGKREHCEGLTNGGWHEAKKRKVLERFHGSYERSDGSLQEFFAYVLSSASGSSTADRQPEITPGSQVVRFLITKHSPD